MYERQYAERHGVDCTINGSVAGRVSCKPSRKDDPDLQRPAWTGWIAPAVVPGDVFSVESNNYIVFDVKLDTSFVAFECNAVIDSVQCKVGEDGRGNLTFTFALAPNALNVHCIGQIIAPLTDPLLLPSTTRLYYVPASTDIHRHWRLIHQCAEAEAKGMGLMYHSDRRGARFQVDSIDDILRPGIKRIQVSPDTRESTP